MGKKVFIFILTLFVAVNLFAIERKITGYYYDRHTGNILERYDDLRPGEVRNYLLLSSNNYTTRVSGNTTYYYDSNGKLAQRVTLTKDANGDVTRIATYRYHADGTTLNYVGYEYYDPATGALTRKNQEQRNEKGQTIGVYNVTYDAQGNVTGSQEYSNYSYYEDGTRKGYERANYNALGEKTAEYGYNYTNDGVMSAYTQKTYDPATGIMTRDFADTRDANGKVAASTALTYNTSGQQIGSDSYTYLDGVAVSRALTSIDPLSGVVTRDYNADYDASGNLAATSDARYNANGEKTYDYNYTYTDGVRATYTTQTYDPATGTVTRDYSASYDAAGQMAASNALTYNTSGQQTGTDNYTYTNGVVTSRATTTIDPATGTVTRNYDAAYDAAGKLATTATVNYNTSGQQTSTDNYTYVDGVRSARAYVTTDPATGTVTRDYNVAYDSAGTATSATDVRYTASGVKSSDTSTSYSSGLASTSTAIYYNTTTGAENYTLTTNYTSYSGTTYTGATQTRVYPNGTNQQRVYVDGVWGAWVTL